MRLPRMLLTFVLTIVVGGIAVGACLAALIPGTVEVATAHHYTTNAVAELSNLAEPSTVYWNDGVTHARHARHAVPRPGEPRPGAPEPDQRGDRHRGPLLLDQRRHRPRRGVPGVPQERHVGADRAGRLHHHPAAREEPHPHQQADGEPQGEGDRGRDPPQQEVLQEEDPRGVPQHRLPGRELLRGEVGRRALLPTSRSTSSPTARPPCSPGSSPARAPTTRSTTSTAAVRRRADVLRGEVEAGYLTQAEADAANNEPMPTVRPPAEQRPTNFLVAEVQDQLLSDPRMGVDVRRAQGPAAQRRLEDHDHLRPQPAATGRDRHQRGQARQGAGLDRVAGRHRSHHRRR